MRAIWALLIITGCLGSSVLPQIDMVSYGEVQQARHPRLHDALRYFKGLLDWLNQNLVTIALVVVTLWATRINKRSLQVAREQFDREWQPDLRVKFTSTDRPSAEIQVANLGRAAAMIETLNVQVGMTDAAPIEKLPLNWLIPGGVSDVRNGHQLLNEYIWKHKIRGPKAQAGQDYVKWREPAVASLGFYSGGRESETSPSKLGILIIKTHFGGTRVEGVGPSKDL